MSKRIKFTIPTVLEQQLGFAPRPMADIPNQEGYRLRLILTSAGLDIRCVVKKDVNGCHYVGAIGEGGAAYRLSQFDGWLPANN